MHLPVEQLPARLAERLGAIHREVGIAQDRVGAFVSRSARGNADAGAGIDLLSVDRERLAQRILHAVGHAHRVARIMDVRQEDGELVAAKPCQRAAIRCGRIRPGDHVLAPQRAREPPRDLGDEAIARKMSQAVVDDLETVEVDEQHRELRIGLAPRVGDRLVEPLQKQRAVGQAGQRVVRRVMDQAIFGALALDGAAEMEADLRHQREQRSIRLQRAFGKELEDRDHFFADLHGKGAGRAEEAFAGFESPEEIFAIRHAGQPFRLAGGEGLAGQPFARGEFAPLRGFTKRAGCAIARVPQRHRSQARLAIPRHHFVGVSERPGQEIADPRQGVLEHVAYRLRQVRGDGDVLQQQQFLFARIEPAQAAFGHRLGFAPGSAFAFQPALDACEFVRVAAFDGLGHAEFQVSGPSCASGSADHRGACTPDVRPRRAGGSNPRRPQ